MSKGNKPRLMCYFDLPAVVRTYETVRTENLTTNPLLRYTDMTPDKPTSWWWHVANHCIAYAIWGSFIKVKCLWGVGHAYSLMLWGNASSVTPKPKSPWDRIVDSILAYVIGLKSRLASPQQSERMQEYARKLRAGLQDSVGDRLGEMMEVQAVMTSANERRKGYASALITVMTVEADKQHRAIWLANSNVSENTAFYNSLGFRTVRVLLIGDENPDWKEDPVKVAIMVRDPGTLNKGKE